MLYEDRTMLIDQNGVTIKRYYFPLGRDKRFVFDEISAVEVRPAGFAAKWRLWGSTNLRNWMPLDMGRPGKEHVVELDLGRRIKPTVTPDDPDRVASLIRERI